MTCQKWYVNDTLKYASGIDLNDVGIKVNTDLERIFQLNTGVDDNITSVQINDQPMH